MNDATRLDQLCVDTLRTLSINAVQQASSGHPGTPMGAAPAVYCLWQRFLRYDRDLTDLQNGDRFVLSVGHASALLFSLIHLCDVKAAAESYPADRFGGLAVTLEAASLAGHLQLSNLCWIYDANHITIEGATSITFSEDVDGHAAPRRRQ